jgi:hypothetical protein
VACTVVAAACRLALATASWDVPGDGPSRTAIALAWASAPELPLCGGWPPGYSSLVGAFSWLVPWLPLTASLMNVVLGTVSVPLLHRIAARAYGPPAGLTAAATLAAFPLHAELSATSLTEVSFGCALLGAAWALIGAAADETAVRRRARLVAGGALVTRSEMPLVDAESFPRLRVVSGRIAQDDVHWRLEALRGALPARHPRRRRGRRRPRTAPERPSPCVVAALRRE